jgi:XrtJ-associated TM-motif-TM protein
VQPRQATKFRASGRKNGRARESLTTTTKTQICDASRMFYWKDRRVSQKRSFVSTQFTMALRRTTVKKLAYIVPAAMLLLTTSLSAFADTVGGCTNSPENPTAVLALVVSATSFGFMQIRNRIGNRRKPDNK